MLLRTCLRSTSSKQLSGEFEMRDLGGPQKILGMDIPKDRLAGKLCLTQEGYLQKLLSVNAPWTEGEEKHMLQVSKVVQLQALCM